MYFVKYGRRYLHDPRSDDERLLSAEMGCALNECGYLTFRLAPGHPLRGELRERDEDNPVEVYDGGELVWEGCVWELGELFDLVSEVTCKGALAYLGDSVVRPYSTVAGEAPLQAPSSVDGYFRWLVEQHNSRVGPAKRFEVGANQGARLDANNHILRSSSQLPTTADEVQGKLLDKLGGYVRIRREGGVRRIDYLAGIEEACDQAIDLGSNLLDLSRTDSAEGVYTAIRPAGGTPEGSESPVTVEELPDGPWAEDTAYRVDGDRIVHVEAARLYGVVELAWSGSEETDPAALARKAVAELRGHAGPAETVEARAVDLHLVDPAKGPLRCGQVARVRSRPHGVDRHMVVCKAELDLCDPSRTVYTLGVPAGTLAGDTRAALRRLDASVAGAYDAMAPIGQAAKDAAAKAEAAVADSWEEYAVSEGPDEPPAGGWSAGPPPSARGGYVWRRAVTAYGDGTSAVGPPARMTGDAGRDGEDAVSLRVESSRGTAFRNNTAQTVLRAVISRGSEGVPDAEALRAAFGAAARLQWRWLRIKDGASGVVSAGDPRLSEGGFALSISADDVDGEATYACDLFY